MLNSTTSALEHTPTAPLPWPASQALTRLELALADRIVANFDHYGSLWGFDTAAKAEVDITEARANGSAVDEWHVTDRDGMPVRIVRTTDPDSTFLGGIDICVFSTWDIRAKAMSR